MRWSRSRIHFIHRRILRNAESLLMTSGPSFRQWNAPNFRIWVLPSCRPSCTYNGYCSKWDGSNSRWGWFVMMIDDLCMCVWWWWEEEKRRGREEALSRTARSLQYSGPVITPRVQYGQQIQYNTIQSSLEGYGFSSAEAFPVLAFLDSIVSI